jgi:hypothetical protein
MGQMFTQDYSCSVGATAQQVWTTAQLPIGMSYMRLFNASPVGGATIWYSRNGQPAAANAPGSLSLAPGQDETWKVPQPPPFNNLSAIAVGGTGSLTAEVG